MKQSNERNLGFTLIELSIVLVIIGLVVGGVMVGRDLIEVANIRAQISQIEKYQFAVNVFKGKYGYLPGDIPAATAVQFGLMSRNGNPGTGDGNDLLEGGNGGNNYGILPQGEPLMFWSDLSNAGLIDGGFNNISNSGFNLNYPGGQVGCSTPSQYTGFFMPQAKIGNGNYVYVWSGGIKVGTQARPGDGDGFNYWGLSAVSSIVWCGNVYVSTPALSVLQASNIDKKIDDGLPISGKVITMYLNGYSIAWPAGNGGVGAQGANLGGWGWATATTTAATPGGQYTCYDNGNVNGAIQQYSIGQSKGAGLNCALSFKFQ